MLPPTVKMGEKGMKTQQSHFSVPILAYVVIKWWSVNLQACKSTQKPHISLILFLSVNEKERMLHAEECVCAHSHMAVKHGCHGDCVACEHIEYAENESLEISEWI